MTTATGSRPVDLEVAAVMDRLGGENFPVASRLLPARLRAHLLAIYGFARLIDEIGDRPGPSPEQRLAELDWAEGELDRALRDQSHEPIFIAVSKTAHAVGVGREPLADLIEANRLDQRRHRCRDYAELEEYCRYSANPVGRLVLAVFGATTPKSVALSDDVCTGLQLVEHWQDVREDFLAGRVYLPDEDLERFAVDPEELAGPMSDALRRLLAFECSRARRLLEQGRPLLEDLDGFARLAVGGFVGGGFAQLDALERARFDVFSQPAKATKGSVARHTFAVLWHRSRNRR
jgi:squalene synthase HpnC